MARTVGYALWLTVRAKPLAVAVIGMAAVLTGTLGTASALLLRDVVDRLSVKGSWPALQRDVALLALVGVAAAMVPPLTQYLQSQVRRAVGEVVQERLATAVTGTVGIGGLEEPAAQDRLRLAWQATSSGPDQMLSAVSGAVQAAVGVVGFTGTLAAMNPWLALLGCLAAVPRLVTQLGVNRARNGMMLRTSGTIRRQMTVRALLLDANSGMELRLFGLGGFFRARLATDLRAVNQAERRVDRRALLSQAPLALLGAAIAAGGLVWSIAMADRGRLTVGDVTVFVAALAAVQSGLASMVQNVAVLDMSAVSFRHLLDALHGSGPRPAAGGAPGPLRTGIELRDVWFRYREDGPWILRGVDLTIRPGQTLALVGANGAGKSTLVKLLCRFYEPTRGRILWDGADLDGLDPERLRDRISAVFQNPTRYDLTAGENIGLGAVDLVEDTDRIRRSAARAGIAPAIEALPDGYRTMLSRVIASPTPGGPAAHGTQLSGGQWQRVGLARGFMREGADLLILDEPSASLDPDAEYQIRTGLRALRATGAALLISHRLSDVRTADRVVVLGGGRILEEGSHEELIEQGGEYARLFALQADGYQDLGELAALP